MNRSTLIVFCLLLLSFPVSNVQATATPQFRAYWVDAFGPGLYSEAQIMKLVSDAKAANMNAIIAQIGRRGDCFCNRAIMPRTEALIAPSPFDPLQMLIDMAHAEGLEVHAWISATAIWSSPIPPKDPNHVFNTHGPSRTGYDNWIMVRYDEVNRGGVDYYLDPGHPDAADYSVRMYTSVVANYDVDGINVDRIRYPDYNLGVNVPSWGYNSVAVARFQAVTGRADIPAPTDPAWVQWRREQITNIVRRIYLEAYAIRPAVRISADTITYGDGPESQGGWENTRAFVEVLQDWRGWMEEGIIDLLIPMNYKREHITAEPDNQRRMSEEWNEFSKDHQYRRHVAIGTGLYLNSIEGSVAQIRKALAPNSAGNYGHGWVGFSYRSPDLLASQGTRSADEARAELTRALTQPSGYDSLTPPLFASPATVPTMGWKIQPTTGHILGRVRTADGVPYDQVRVDLYDENTEGFIGSRLTDGSGWFGFVDLAPGRYKLVVDCSGARSPCVRVTSVSGGRLAIVSVTPFMFLH